MPLPWRNWYHCMASTYGQWLPGDPRGFRTRHHREHIEGDYKNPPPPGKYTQRHNHAKSLLKRPPVWLPWEARVEACKRIAEALKHYNVEVIDLCVTATHFHVLARFSPYVDDTLPPSPPTGVGGLSPVDSKVVDPAADIVGPSVPQLAAPGIPDAFAADVPWEQLQARIESMPGYYTEDDDINATSHDATSHNATSHDATSHDAASHDSASHDSASHDATPDDVNAPDTNIPAAPQSPPTPVGGLCPAHHRNDGLDPRPRYLIGKAKSWCSRHVKAARLLAPAAAPAPGTPASPRTPATPRTPAAPGTPRAPAAGGLFAKRGKIVPIESRRHQLAVVRYIRRHVNEGGAVYTLIRT